MNIDFSLVLVVLTGFTGAIVLFDVIFLAPKRKRAVANYQQEIQKEAKGSVDSRVVEGLLRMPLWIEYPRSFFPVLFIVLLLRSFLLEPFKIPSGSMKPTLLVGDFILVNKFEYGLRLPVIGTMIYPLGQPKRGDVLVFKYPDNPRINYIKRVVGLPGDHIRYFDKKLTVNGVPVEQKLIAELPPGRPEIQMFEESLGETHHHIWNNVLDNRTSGEWIVEDNSYFVMGDNRDNSRDSRVWGFVPDKLVVGRAFAVWMHMPEWVPSFKRNGLIQ